MNNKDFKIINGNSLEVLDTLEANSIDAIVTDPPYELGFMGKSWDSTGIAYNVELWKKALKVLKPGGHLLAFGGTRTYHRICCAIEDAGFEIRDCIMWLYGSGFPKSHNVGLDIDKINGCGDRGHRIAVANRHHPDGTLEPNGENLPKYEGKTELGKQWAGWGTALKPAYEPIIMARKPIKETVAKNVLKYGVGGINIDECRVGNEEMKAQVSGKTSRAYQSEKTTTAGGKGEDHIGRFPANVIHDGSEQAVAGFPNTTGNNPKELGDSGFWFGENRSDKQMSRGYDDEGSASRYFYCAKASSKDRDEGLDLIIDTNNIHPTVKPVELMQYLVRLVAPKNATILDIFNGSGSTGKAVAFENRERNANYKYIGIELDPNYCKISEARIEYALHKYKYDLQETIKENEKKGQLSLFDNFDD